MEVMLGEYKVPIVIIKKIIRMYILELKMMVYYTLLVIDLLEKKIF
jgi:hypothetical protein